MSAGTVQDEINRISRAIEAQKDEADTKRKDERDERALEAQWEAALWAKYSGWAAWISAVVAGVALIVTGIGVLLVLFTLRHTRDAAIAAKDMVVEARATTKAAQDSVEEARKATKFAQITADAAREALAITDRAWIEIEVVLTDPLVFGPEKIETSARFIFRNIGKAPATNVSTTMRLHVDDLAAGHEAGKYSREPSTMAAASRHFGLGRVIFPGGAHVEERSFEISTADFKARIVEANEWGAKNETPYTVTTEHPCILAGVTYWLPGDRSERFTYMPFKIVSTRATHPGWDGEECVESAGDLTIKLSSSGGFVK